MTAMKRRPGRPHVEPPARGTIDARTIRLNSRSVAVTQAGFARAIGVSVKTLRNWEQGRREPTGPARVLLRLLERDPWLVFDVENDQHVITPVAQYPARSISAEQRPGVAVMLILLDASKCPAGLLDSSNRFGLGQTAAGSEKRMGDVPIKSTVNSKIGNGDAGSGLEGSKRVRLMLHYQFGLRSTQTTPLAHFIQSEKYVAGTNSKADFCYALKRGP